MQDSFLCLLRFSLIFLEARRFFNFMRNSKFIEIQKYAIHLYKNKKIAPRTYVSKKLLLKKWCPDPESNQRHGDFQSPALPTELSGQTKYVIGGPSGT